MICQSTPLKDFSSEITGSFLARLYKNTVRPIALPLHWRWHQHLLAL